MYIWLYEQAWHSARWRSEGHSEVQVLRFMVFYKVFLASASYIFTSHLPIAMVWLQPYAMMSNIRTAGLRDNTLTYWANQARVTY